MPTLVFPAVESPEFKEVMAANQALAERTAYTIDEALAPISAVAKLRNRETSRRLAGPLRSDSGKAAGHEGAVLRVQLGVCSSQERPS